MRNIVRAGSACPFTKTIAATFALALAFTLSCSDDKDEGSGGGTGACKYTTQWRNQTIEICDYAVLAEIGETADELKAECQAEVSGTFYESCPGGYVLVCNDEEDTLYLYGDALKNVDCDTFFTYY